MRDGREVWAEVLSHPNPVARELLRQTREAGVAQMADRTRSVWSPKLTVLATNLPVDHDVDLLVTEGELMRGARLAVVAKRTLEARGWWLLAAPAARGWAGNRRTTAESVVESLLQNRLSFTSFPVLLPVGRNLVPGRLHVALPVAEAFRRAA